MPEERSIVDVIDDTLGELGLPGLKDIIPLPADLLRMFGIPTPDEIATEVSRKVRASVERKVK